MTDQDKLQLDPNPTPKGESKDFENPDDTRRREDNAHSLALLAANQGKIGAYIGSSDSNLTIAFCVILIAGLCTVASLIGMAWHPDSFFEAVKFFGTVMLTVAGYVFGVKTTKS